MNYEYEVCCTVNWGNTVDPIDILLKELNNVLAMHGVEWKYMCESEFTLTIICNRELTDKELYRMKVILANIFLGEFGKYDIRVEAIRRKSDKSRSQSKSR